MWKPRPLWAQGGGLRDSDELYAKAMASDWEYCRKRAEKLATGCDGSGKGVEQVLADCYEVLWEHHAFVCACRRGSDG